ncbi:MAG: aldo/keto reductase [Chloroflexota bacterium]
MTIHGKATVDKTAVYAQNFPQLTHNPLPHAGWHVSQAGFGGYRVDVAQPSHQAALRYALQNGINLIDTSSNYADGGSEELIGVVMGNMIAADELCREQVVVVSKVGYLQGQNYELSQQRKASGQPFPELVEYAEGLEHCIHPEFLADQLMRSLKRLNMDTIDAYLLHNPEYFLSHAHKQGVDLNAARQTYYERIYRAFVYLEEVVENGRIQAYGVSSNSFPSDPADPQFSSLALMWQLAESISPNHHFRVVQMPMNLLETGGATELNCNGRSSLTFAHEKGLGVLINRPLNAFRLNALTRLANVEQPASSPSPTEVSTAFDTLLPLEEEFTAVFAPSLPFPANINRNIVAFLAVGQQLQGHWSGFGSFQNWRRIHHQILLPRCKSAVQYLSDWDGLTAELKAWLENYAAAASEALIMVSRFYQAQAAEQTERIWQTAVSADPDWQADTLSQTAVSALRTTQGVSAVLAGMRQQAYINDVLTELRRPIASKNRDQAWQQLMQAY